MSDSLPREDGEFTFPDDVMDKIRNGPNEPYYQQPLTAMSMLLRDYFAIHAPADVLMAMDEVDRFGPVGAATPHTIARNYSALAYVYADKMLAERQK